MKNLLVIILLFCSITVFPQGQFNTPTFTYNGQTYKVNDYTNVGLDIIYIRNTNQVYSGTNPMLRPPMGGEKYCSETEYPVDHQDFNLKAKALVSTLFSKQRRVALNEPIQIEVIVPAGNTQIAEVTFKINASSKLSREEIYKMEQAIKGINIKLHPHTCTYRYVITYTAFNPSNF